MAASGYTPISLYYSSTTTNTPSSGNLVNGELAINIADGKLFYKDSSGNVQVIATKGGVGSSSTTQVLYNSSGLVVGSSNLTFDSTTLTAGGFSGPHNGTVGATTPNTGVFTTAKAIAASTQDAVLLQGRAGGTGSYAVTITPTTLGASRTLTLPDASGTILQSGTAVTIGQGGTGQTTANAGFNALSPMTTAGDIIYGGVSGAGTRLGIGTNGYVLTVSGGNPVWAAASAGSPGGSTTQIQYNNGGSFAGSANLTFDGTTLTAAGLAGPFNGTVGATTANTGTFSSTVHKGATSGTVTITAPSVAGTQSYTLPTALPTVSGQLLSSTTAGVLSWVSTLPTISLTVDFLVIAGGGGGGSGGGGGGGAGGYRTSTGTSGGGGSAESSLTLNVGTAYTVTVGGGGTGGTVPGYAVGGTGSNSVLDTITSLGGGGGSAFSKTPTSGGSGGGVEGNNNPSTGGAGTANQGFAGGNWTTGGFAGAGGGGAGAAGTTKSTANASTGGNGVASSITGSSVTRAGGGGGGSQGAYGGGSAAAGGTGGGGAGSSTSAAGTAGTTNTGSGGGGGGYTGSAGAGGNGGSGVVYIQIPSARTATFSAGVTSSVATVGAYKVYTVTATSTTSETVTFS